MASLANSQGDHALDISAIEERLRSIDGTLARIENHRLSAIEDHLRALNGRVGEVEKWQAGADAMFDSLNERVTVNTDRQEKFEADARTTLQAHRSLLDKTEGGLSARGQMITQFVLLAGLAIALLKLFLFHS